MPEAARCYEHALGIRSDLADARQNLAATLVERGRRHEAIACYQEAVRLNPNSAEAHWSLARLFLQTGDFERGWQEFEWRLEHPVMKLKRPFREPRWDGSDLGGRTILLYTEGGFGDALQFCRYVPLVARRGGRVLLECPRQLETLLASADGAEQVIALGKKLPPFDVHAPLQSLPLAFGTGPDTVPADVPYLHPDAKLAANWRARPEIAGCRFKVGLAWSGSRKDMKRNNPNCGLTRFAPLAEVSGVTFYSLQKGDAATETRQPPPGIELIDLTKELNDFGDTAALVSALDLVISVDTSVVHLAGAMGKPVWTVLGWLYDFRWILGREDSPWYPTMRLFRPAQEDDWEEVFRRIASELRKAAAVGAAP